MGTTPRSLAQLAADQAAEVADFLAKHPEFEEGRFERDHHERRWVGRKNLTTYPIDPDTLNEMDLGTTDGRSTKGRIPESAGEYEDGQLTLAVLWPRSEALTWQQDWTRDLVEAAFEHMRRQDVSLLQRRYFERMTLDAIAAEEGVTRQAIIKRLKGATRKLRALLDGEA